MRATKEEVNQQLKDIALVKRFNSMVDGGSGFRVPKATTVRAAMKRIENFKRKYGDL